MRQSLLIALLLGACASAQERINPDSLILAKFQNKVDAYVQLRKSIEAKLPPLKPGATAEEMQNHQRTLATRVRRERRQVQQGNLLAPETEAEFRRLVGIATSGDGGKDARAVAKSLQHAEPVQFRIQVNETYPDNVPKQSTPPTLLANFPRLPPQVEYRVVGQQLVLVDPKIDLILDVSKGAVLPKPE